MGACSSRARECFAAQLLKVRYGAPVVEGNAENLNMEKVLMDAKHVRFFSHWARLRPLPQRGLNLGRGSDLYPSVD